MTTAEELLNSMLGLSQAEQTKFLQLLRGMGKMRKAKGEQQETETSVVLLYDAVAREYLNATGLRLPSLAVLRKGTPCDVVLKQSVEWLTAGKDIKRPTLLALFSLAAQALVCEQRFNPRLQTNPGVCRALSTIPAAVDRAYPSYRANNLLVPIAERIAAGTLPYDKTTEDF